MNITLFSFELSLYKDATAKMMMNEKKTPYNYTESKLLQNFCFHVSLHDFIQSEVVDARHNKRNKRKKHSKINYLHKTKQNKTKPKYYFISNERMFLLLGLCHVLSHTLIQIIQFFFSFSFHRLLLVFFFCFSLIYWYALALQIQLRCFFYFSSK